MFIEELGEFGLVNKIKNLVSAKDSENKNLLVSVGDDAAVFRTNHEYLSLLTTDTLIENVHFQNKYFSPYELGYKGMAAALSDVAAMAGLPRYALVSLGLKPKTQVEFVEEVYRGMLDLSQKFKVEIIGGDTTSSPQSLWISLTLWGEVEPHLLRRRGEAKIGEIILVTGKMGASALGLEILMNPELEGFIPEANKLKEKHLLPEPRLKAARIASRLGAHALEDISDGLLAEVKHICEESGTGAEIYVSQIPLATGAKKAMRIFRMKDLSPGSSWESSLDFALGGGEDYEIVFTAPSDKISKIKKEVGNKCDLEVTKVGKIVEGRGVSVLDSQGKTIEKIKGGFEHF